MSQTEITLRPLTVEDFDAVIALKGAVLKRPGFDPLKEKRLYEWALTRNPCRQDDFPVGFVLESAGRIVGSVVLMPACCRLNGKKTYTSFEVDLAVSEDFRFHGLKLLSKVWKTGLFPVVFGTTPNRTSFDLEVALGAKGIPFTACKYIKFIDPVSVGIKKHSSKLMGILLGSANIFLAVLGKAISPSLLVVSRERFTKERIERFDERFDKFFEEAAINYGLIHSRDSKFLNWRFLEFPFGQRSVYAISDSQKQLRGYVVIQEEKTANGTRTGNILEILTKKEDRAAVLSLVDAAIAHASEFKLEQLEMVPCGEHVEPALTFAGFLKRKLSIPSCIYKNNVLEECTAAEETNTWFLSAADGDTAVYAALSRET